MSERRRNQFERKCRVCGSFGVPTADGRVMHFGRIATCREHVIVEGGTDGAQTATDELDTTTSSIHTTGDVQGAHGQSERRDSRQGQTNEQFDAYFDALASSPKPFA